MVLQTERFLFGVKGQVHPKKWILSLLMESLGMFLNPQNISGASQQNWNSWRLVLKRKKKKQLEKINKMVPYSFSDIIWISRSWGIPNWFEKYFIFILY